MDFRVIEEWLSDAPERHAMPKEQQNATTAAIGAAAKTAAASGVEAFDLARLEMATGPQAEEYRPFRTLTRAELVRAAAEIRTVQDKLRYRDDTIAVDPALERAVLTLGDAGMPLNEHRFAATERAFVRAEIYEAANGALSPNEKARMILYDVATQEEARGLELIGRGGVLSVSRGMAIAKPAQELVSSMGIRTLEKDGLGQKDITMAAVGHYERVSEFHRAGIDLGATLARAGGPGAAALDARLERLASQAPEPVPNGLDRESEITGGDAEGTYLSEAVTRGIASQASDIKFELAIKPKGRTDPDASEQHSFAMPRGRGRD